MKRRLVEVRQSVVTHLMVCPLQIHTNSPTEAVRVTAAVTSSFPDALGVYNGKVLQLQGGDRQALVKLNFSTSSE